MRKAMFNNHRENSGTPSISQELLAEILRQKEYSLSKLATETKISSTQIRRILGGDTKSPRPLHFQRIFELYCRVCLQ